MAGQKSCEEVRLNSFTLEKTELPSNQNIYRLVSIYRHFIDESEYLDIKL